MELNDALRIPLGAAAVWDALHDAALVRASIEHCESFHRLAPGEYALTLTVPLGPLRARYEVRAHVANDGSQPPQPPRRILSFRARADGIGSVRGQIDVALRAEPSATGESTRIDYAVWATLNGPLADLPSRQIENALHELADDFFTEFCAVVEAKHGQRPNRASDAPPRRQHVFLRPISMAGIARRARLLPQYGGAPASRAIGAVPHEPTPHVVPNWAWAAMIFFVALLLYVARRLSS
ncbi:MAG TPA: SRPBCC domain-containing protein [Paraburkholderia sp.]